MIPAHILFHKGCTLRLLTPAQQPENSERLMLYCVEHSSELITLEWKPNEGVRQDTATPKPG